MLGPFGQFPLALGGGKPRALRAFEQIRRALGNATAAGGIDELIRRAEAKGLAASTTHRRRAVRQAFPRLSRDALGYYERAMYRTPRPGEPAATRAATVSALGNTRPDATIARIEESLSRLDQRFSVAAPTWSSETTTVAGRTFAPLYPGLEPTFGPPWHRSSPAPNYATTFRVRVLFAVGYAGQLLPEDARLLERAKTELRRLVPSWVTFSVLTSAGGFILDESLLDITGMNP